MNSQSVCVERRRDTSLDFARDERITALSRQQKHCMFGPEISGRRAGQPVSAQKPGAFHFDALIPHQSSEIARIHNDNITFLTRILITIENLVLAIIAGIVLIIVLI